MDQNGVLKFQAQYVHGALTGDVCQWDEAGKMLSRQAYLNSRLHGRSLYWYQNGQIKKEESYDQGRRNGRFTKWSQDGKVIERQTYVNGVRIPTQIQNLINKGELNARHILEIKNGAVRHICLEELGYARFLSQLDHVVIDRDGEYELVRIDWHKREEPLNLVKVKCPSTGAFYTLRVPPTVLTVKEAISWTFYTDKEQYQPEVET